MYGQPNHVILYLLTFEASSQSILLNYFTCHFLALLEMLKILQGCFTVILISSRATVTTESPDKTGANMISSKLMSRPTLAPASGCDLALQDENKRAEGEPESQSGHLTSKHWYEILLCWSRIELAFLTAFHMVPWFEFVTKTMLVTHQPFNYC